MPFGSWFVARGSWMWVPNDDHDTTTAQEEEEAGYHQRLCDEIGAGNVIELRRLLAHRTPRQWEALLVRAAVRGVPLLEVLVQRGADVRSVAPRLMNTAAGVGQVELLRYLLAARGEPNVASNGEHPLVAACARRQYECARVLLEANADLASLPSRELSKVLVSAVSGSSTSLVRLLAEHRAPIADFVSERGDSLLHSAPSAEMIELLVELGVDPNRVNRAGRSALAVRACFSDTMLLVALLRAHADVNQRDAFEWTPLHHACAASNTRAAAVLIEYGADKHAIANEYGGRSGTPAQLSNSRGIHEVLRATEYRWELARRHRAPESLRSVVFTVTMLRSIVGSSSSLSLLPNELLFEIFAWLS